LKGVLHFKNVKLIFGRDFASENAAPKGVYEGLQARRSQVMF